MGLFFHELEIQFKRYGTQCWSIQSAQPIDCLIHGTFVQVCKSKRFNNNMKFSLNQQKIFLQYQTGKFKSLELCLTAMEQHFYLLDGKRVYEIKLMKDDLITTIVTFDMNEFVKFYCHLAQYCVLNNFEKHFRVKKQLGSGAFSIVYEGVNILSNLEVALKVFQKSKLIKIQDGINILRNQIINLQKLKRFHLSPLIEIYETEDCVILVMQKAQNGNMIEFIQQHLQDYNEKFIKTIMFQTLQSLNELHKAGFVHRDIKPENILFNSHLKDFSIFLTDFGLSIQKQSRQINEIASKCSGTMGFVAPQIFNGNKYDQKCDLFSVGCLFYFLLTGKSLFGKMSMRQFSQKTTNNDFVIRQLSYLPQSSMKNCKDLLLNLLKTNPTDRCSANQALKHQYFIDQQLSLQRSHFDNEFDETFQEFITQKINNYWAKCKCK